jgi:hypothetical protein
MSTAEAIQQARSNVDQYVIIPMHGNTWSIVHITAFFAEVQGGFKSREAAQKYANKHGIEVVDQ